MNSDLLLDGGFHDFHPLIVGGENEKGVEVCPKECCYKLMTIDEIINGKVRELPN